MTIKIIMTILAFSNGAFMLIDGVHVLAKGKYIGPEKPGSWANLFYKFKINVFKLGPLFIFFGLAWLFWVYALWFDQSWIFIPGLLVSVFTLWYVKVGTFISIVIITLLIIFKQQFILD